MKSESTVSVFLNSFAIIDSLGANLLFPNALISTSDSSDSWRLELLSKSPSSSSSYGVEWYEGQSWTDYAGLFWAYVVMSIFSSSFRLNSVRLCTLTESEAGL
jgi:hypothetical protein